MISPWKKMLEKKRKHKGKNQRSLANLQQLVAAVHCAATTRDQSRWLMRIQLFQWKKKIKNSVPNFLICRGKDVDFYLIYPMKAGAKVRGRERHCIPSNTKISNKYHIYPNFLSMDENAVTGRTAAAHLLGSNSHPPNPLPPFARPPLRGVPSGSNSAPLPH